MTVNSLHPNRRVFATQWMWLAAVLLVSGSLLAVDAYRDYNTTLATESERVMAASRVVQLSVEDSLEHADKVLLALRQEMVEHGINVTFNVRLKTLADAMPMIRTFTIHDTNGTIQAASRPEMLGTNRNFVARDYFKQAQQGKAETLFITPPFLATTGVYTVVLSRKLTDKSGAFAGVITVSLDPTSFLPFLDSVRYADDMLASLQHSAGVVFGVAPMGRADLIGRNRGQPWHAVIQTPRERAYRNRGARPAKRDWRNAADRAARH